MKNGKYDIYVVEVGGEYRVRPAVAAIEKAKKLGIRNTTAHKVIIVLPGIIAGDYQTLGPHESTPEPGLALTGEAKAHGYKVIVQVGDNLVLASGESDPILIIDP